MLPLLYFFTAPTGWHFLSKSSNTKLSPISAALLVGFYSNMRITKEDRLSQTMDHSFAKPLSTSALIS